MRTLIWIASFLGVLALVRQLLHSTLTLAREGLETSVLHMVARTRAQSGDLSALSEANQLAIVQRKRRLRRWAEVLGLIGLLFAPTLTTYSMYIYALYNLFWYVGPSPRKVVPR